MIPTGSLVSRVQRLDTRLPQPLPSPPPSLPPSLRVRVTILILASFFASHSKIEKKKNCGWVVCLFYLNILKYLDRSLKKMKYFFQVHSFWLEFISHWKHLFVVVFFCACKCFSINVLIFTRAEYVQ